MGKTRDAAWGSATKVGKAKIRTDDLPTHHALIVEADMLADAVKAFELNADAGYLHLAAQATVKACGGSPARRSRSRSGSRIGGPRDRIRSGRAFRALWSLAV